MAHKKFVVDVEPSDETPKIKIKTTLHMLGADLFSAMKKIPVYKDQFCAYAATMLTIKRASVQNPSETDVVAAYAQASLYSQMLENGAAATMPAQRETFNYGDFLKAHDLTPVMRDLKWLAQPITDIPSRLKELKDQAAELFKAKLGPRCLAEVDASLQTAYGALALQPVKN